MTGNMFVAVLATGVIVLGFIWLVAWAVNVKGMTPKQKAEHFDQTKKVTVGLVGIAAVLGFLSFLVGRMGDR